MQMNNKNVSSEWVQMLFSSFTPTLHGLDSIIASIISVHYEAFIAIYRFHIEADWALFWTNTNKGLDCYISSLNRSLI